MNLLSVLYLWIVLSYHIAHVFIYNLPMSSSLSPSGLSITLNILLLVTIYGSSDTFLYFILHSRVHQSWWNLKQKLDHEKPIITSIPRFIPFPNLNLLFYSPVFEQGWQTVHVLTMHLQKSITVWTVQYCRFEWHSKYKKSETIVHVWNFLTTFQLIPIPEQPFTCFREKVIIPYDDVYDFINYSEVLYRPSKWQKRRTYIIFCSDIKRFQEFWPTSEIPWPQEPMRAFSMRQFFSMFLKFITPAKSLNYSKTTMWKT